MSSFLGAALGGLGGGAIGSAVVTLALDQTQYQTQLKTAQASGVAATSVQTKALASMGSAAVVAYAAAGAAAISFAKASVEAALESEEVQARLEQAVTGSTDAFTEQASALQSLTGFSDEAILSADTLLTRFDLTNAQIQSAIPTVLDYARAVGKEVPDAATAIGKALLGNARALKEVGISYTATGDTAKDFTNVLGLLEDKVGGTAEAFGKTTAGQIEIFNQQVDELKESVGSGLLPVLNEAISTTNDFTDALNGNLDAVEDMPGSLENFAAGLLVATGGAGQLAGFLDATKAASEDTAQAFDEQTTAALEGRMKAAELAAGMDDLTAAEKQAAAETKRLEERQKELKDSLEDVFTTSEDVWSSMLEQSRVTANGIIRNFEKQIRAQENFAENFKEVESRAVTPASQRMLEEIVTTFGDQAPAILEKLANVNNAKFNEIVGDWKTFQGQAKTNTDAVADFTAKVNGIPTSKTVTLSVNIIPTLESGALAGYNATVRDAILSELHRVNST